MIHPHDDEIGVGTCDWCGEPLDENPVVDYGDLFHVECWSEIQRCEGAAHLSDYYD